MRAALAQRIEFYKKKNTHSHTGGKKVVQVSFFENSRVKKMECTKRFYSDGVQIVFRASLENKSTRAKKKTSMTLVCIAPFASRSIPDSDAQQDTNISI